MSDQNKRVLDRFFKEVWSQGSLAVLDELLARDWLGHAPPAEFGGPGELKAFIAAQRLAFPDLKIVVVDQIAEGDRVATRWTARGTHQGEFQGRSPTGQSATWAGITLARLANGKIIEDWTAIYQGTTDKEKTR
jgi:steroid delta-isomerase-like uncharacterized protein